ncbi:MAG: four helix bundle protein [Candidatus Omnitrophota bacterium]
MEKAYENLKFYQNICEMRRLIYKITERFCKSHMRLVGQMRDSARSAKQNIREGYSKDTAGEFAHSIRISRGSLDELEGDVDDCYEDRLVTKKEYDNLKRLFRQTKYQIDRYLDALHKLNKEGKWKSRFKR